MEDSIFSSLERGTKRAMLKKQILSQMMKYGNLTIPDTAKRMELSIPTITKLIDELSTDGYICEKGKLETSGGRHPSLYSLNPTACYFIGVAINKFDIDVAMINLNGDIINKELAIPFKLENTSECLLKACSHVKEFIKNTGVDTNRIMNINVNISGRVNPSLGYSYSIFYFNERPLSETLSNELGYHVTIDNDTRAMTYAEHLKGAAVHMDNMIYLNLSWGLGMGIVIDGELYQGKSGLSGELGHVYCYDNEILCHCGKKGCMETEISGSALFRKLKERTENGESSILLDGNTNINDITLNDFIKAIKKEDILCIDLLEKMSDELGKQIAGLVNIFNPTMIVIGGPLSQADDYILFPLKNAIRKYTLNLMTKDCQIVCSTLKQEGGIIGACLMARKHIFEQL